MTAFLKYTKTGVQKRLKKNIYHELKQESYTWTNP